MKPPFQTSEKKNPVQILKDIETLNSSPVIEGLMSFVDGCVAVLNSNRQIVSLNCYLMKQLDIQDPSTILGLRLGEVVSCNHALQNPEECGCTKYCSSCGAAIATMASLYNDEEDEKNCIIKRENSLKPDIMLRVKTRPIRVRNEKFVLLFLQDITLEQRRAALERTFFHDISNVLSGLSGASSLLEEGVNNDKLYGIIRSSSNTLCREVEIQRYLSGRSNADFKPEQKEISIQILFKECDLFCSSHPASRERTLKCIETEKCMIINSDFSISQRILNNMVINAMEASEQGDTITLRAELTGNRIVFSVHNRQSIPEEVQLRIFQRNFSTKNKEGRGIGTYSMKFLGEEILPGKIRFESSRNNGTTFYFSLPMNI